MGKFLNSFIPKRISGGTVVWAYELMRSVNKGFGKKFIGNLQLNEDKYKAHEKQVFVNNGYIEDQFRYSDMAYGQVTVKYSGCEVISVYNALVNLKDERLIVVTASQGSLSESRQIITFPGLLDCFEKDGMARNGKFGTAPKALRDYFESIGYETRYSSKERDFEQISIDYDSLLYTMYNDAEDIMAAVHTVNISKDANGFTGHNVDMSGKPIGPERTLSDLLKRFNGGRTKGICIIGVRRKQNK